MTLLARHATIPRASRRSKTGLCRGANEMTLETARDHFVAALGRGEIATERQCTPNTQTRYKAVLRQFIDWVKVHAIRGRVDCHQFTADLVKQYLAYRHDERHVSRNTLSLDSTILRGFAAWGASKDVRYWRWDDVEGIRYVKKQPTLPRPFNPTERDDMMALALPPADAALRALLYYCGLRNAEVCGIRLEDLRQPYSLPTGEVPASVRVIGKGMKERIVPLHPDGWAALELYLGVRVNEATELTEYLFRSLPQRGMKGTKGKARPWTDSMVQARTKAWGALVAAAKATPHRWRHTFATDVLDATDNLRTTQELLGHASPQTTAIYTKVTDKRKAEAVLKLPSFRRTTAPADCPTAGDDATGPHPNP